MGVIVDDGEDFCDVDSFIFDVNDDPHHQLHGTTDIHKPAELDVIDNEEHDDGVVDYVNATATQSNIIHIPQPPKNTRRAGFDAVKHAFKKLTRRF